MDPDGYGQVARQLLVMRGGGKDLWDASCQRSRGDHLGAEIQ